MVILVVQGSMYDSLRFCILGLQTIDSLPQFDQLRVLDKNLINASELTPEQLQWALARDITFLLCFDNKEKC